MQRDLNVVKNTGMKCILFRTEHFKYEDSIADGCFFDYSMLENILDAIK